MDTDIWNGQLLRLQCRADITTHCSHHLETEFNGGIAHQVLTISTGAGEGLCIIELFQGVPSSQDQGNLGGYHGATPRVHL